MSAKLSRAASVVLVFAAGCAREAPARPPATSVTPPAPSASVAAAPTVPPIPAAPKEKPPLSPPLAALVAARKPGDTPKERQEQLLAMLEGISKDRSPKTDALLVEAVKAGLHDEPQWVTIESQFRGHRAKIRVSTDALKINGVRIDLSAVAAQQVADTLGTILPTPQILDLVWKQATLKFPPCNQPPDEKMHAFSRMLEHSRCVDDRIKGAPGLAANVGKDWVLTNALDRESGMAANYGWFRRGQRPIQTVGTRHDKVYADYSQIVRLVNPVVTVDGRDMDIRAVGRSEELWGLVTDQGPLRVWRVDLKSVDPSQVAAARAETPATPQFPPSSAKPVAFAAQGHPLAVDQLPDTTFALRHARPVRLTLDAAHLDEADLPEEAIWSTGAALCGYRDLFFETLSGIKLTEAEAKENLATFQKALTCGQAVAFEVKKGRTYEVDYTFGGEPTSFALMRFALRNPPLPSNFPRLPTAPAGAIVAACRDGDGATTRACEHGDRSRLLLGVNGGLVGAYLRESTELLQRIGTAKPAPADVKTLRELYDGLETFDSVNVARADYCTLVTDVAMAQESQYLTSTTELMHSLMDNARFCAVGRSGSGRKGQLRMVFVAKDEAGAKAVEAALKKRVADIGAEAPAMDNLPTNARAFRDAVRAMHLRVLRAAPIQRQGDRVVLDLAIEPTEKDTKAMTPYYEERKAQATKAAAVVRALKDGKVPAADLLQGKKR